MKREALCIDCNGDFPPECMDFDHVRGVKLNNVGTMVTHGHSRERVMEEIAKCDLVCANCHRIRTKSRQLNKGGYGEHVPTLAEDAEME